MAKTIKRIGIIFFVLVASLLIVVGSVFAVRVTSNDNNLLADTSPYIEDTVVEANNGVTPPDTSTPDFKLEGTNANKITVWNNATTKSIDEKVNVVVKLMNDWDVSSVADHSFGAGTGFDHGRIWIKAGANITLDLNGHKINKGLTTLTANGHVIRISGTFTLVDSSYNADVALSTARTNSANLKNLPYGKITGGYCTDGENGAGIRMEKINGDPVFNMYGGIITGNQAQGQGGGIGVVDPNKYYSINIFNGIICDNIAGNEGGGIYIGGSDNLTIKGAIIANNTAKAGGGGGIKATSGYTSCKITNALVINNHSQSAGGGIYVSGQSNPCVISNSEIIGNENGEEMNGGGIHIGASAIVTIENCVIKENIANSSGAGLYAQNNLNLTMKNCKVLNNTASENGGGIFLGLSANANITDTIIDGNKALNGYAGGLVANNNAYNMRLSNVTISNNQANSYGAGFVAHANSKVEIHKSNISSNTGVSNGAGIHISTGSVWVITESTISGNSSTDGLGSGVYCNMDTKVLMTNSNILNNTAKSGAGIYVNTRAMVGINGTEISGNTTLTDSNAGGGGGLYINSNASVSLGLSSIVKNNVANLNVGGIYLNKTANLMIAPSTRIYDNKLQDTNEIRDIYLPNGKQLELIEKINVEEGKKIYIQLADNYDKFTPFTSGFAFNNPNEDPNDIFACNDSNKKAVLKDGEVIFDEVDKSIYDFVYLEDRVRKNYRDNNKLYGYNDSDITGKVLGKIAPETTVDTFVQELKFDITKLQIYNKEVLVYDKGNKLVDGVIGTGWKIVYDGAEIYLSVLGDITGDGRIDATDITTLRQIANGEIAITDLHISVQLAAYVDNRGKVTSIDAEILRAVCKYETTISKYY